MDEVRTLRLVVHFDFFFSVSFRNQLEFFFVLFSFRSPREKSRGLLVNVFRTRRSNVALNSNEVLEQRNETSRRRKSKRDLFYFKATMPGKQMSVSVMNLTSSVGSNRTSNVNAHNSSMNSQPSTHLNLLDQRKHALSEENLTTSVRLSNKVFVLLIDRLRQRGYFSSSRSLSA